MKASFILAVYALVLAASLARADAPQIEVVRTTTVCSRIDATRLQCTTLRQGKAETKVCELARGRLVCTKGK